jgi:hypothetical protein
MTTTYPLDLPGDHHDTLTSDEDRRQRGNVRPDARPRPGRPPRTVTLPDVSAVRSRQASLFPYLLVRAFPGDTGARPYTRYLWWETPDIHLVPDIDREFDFANTILAPRPGRAYRAVVHTWNFGPLPVPGVRVRLWTEPLTSCLLPQDSLTEASPPTPVASAYVSLGPRNGKEAHRLVPLDGVWTPSNENEAHSSLYATIDSSDDPWKGCFAAYMHRHVARRSIITLAPDESLSTLLRQLTMPVNLRPKEAIIVTAVPVQRRAVTPFTPTTALASRWAATPLLTGNTDLLLTNAYSAEPGRLWSEAWLVTRDGRWDYYFHCRPGDYVDGFECGWPGRIREQREFYAVEQVVDSMCRSIAGPMGHGRWPDDKDVTAAEFISGYQSRFGLDPSSAGGAMALRLIIGTLDQPATRGCTIVMYPRDAWDTANEPGD